MATNLSATIQKSIQLSRQRYLLADYQGAFNALPSLDGTEIVESQHLGTIAAEIVRLHVLNGDYQAANAVFQNNLELPKIPLLLAQKAYVKTMTNCDIAGALKVGKEVWERVGDDTKLSEEDARTVYYCLEIFDLIDNYGNQKQKRKLPVDEYQQQVIGILYLQLLLGIDGLQPEALQLAARLSQPESALPALVDYVDRNTRPAEIDTSLFLLRLLLNEGEINHDEAKARVRTIESSSCLKGHRTASLDIWAFRLRYLEPEEISEERIQNLLEVAKQYFQQRYFEKAIWVLEDVVDLLAEFGLKSTTWIRETGLEVHKMLEEIHDSCGDQFGLLEVRFRKCDLLNSLTPHLARAREERQGLLKSPLSITIPGFQRFHLRQAEEYMMLNQAEDAMYHARKYRDYCRRCQRTSEKSLAQNMVFHNLWSSKRAAIPSSFASHLKRAIGVDDAALDRINHALSSLSTIQKSTDSDLDQLAQILQQSNTRFEVETLIIEKEEFLLSKAEKYLLLVEVAERQRTLDGWEKEDIAEELLDFLELADESCKKIDDERFQRRRMALQNQIRMLKVAIGLFDIDHRVDEEKAPTNIDLTTRTIEDSYRLLVIGEAQNSLHIFDHLVGIGKQKESDIELAGSTLQNWSVYEFQATMLYILMTHDEPDFKPIWKKAGFTTLLEGLQLVLHYVKKVLDLQESLITELRRSTCWKALRRKQALITGITPTFLIETVLDICFELGVPELTWEWIQRAKGRAYADELLLRTSERKSEELSFPMITENDLQWASSATKKKMVYVDWAPRSDETSPFMLVVLSFERNEDGALVESYSQHPINISRGDIAQCLDNFDSNLYLSEEDAQDYLDSLQGLISPLETCSDEGDILVLCPTAPLHNFPLHALHLGNKVLLERNPVVYVPCLSVLISCIRRLEAPEPNSEISKLWRAAITGTYEDASHDANAIKERDDIYESLGILAGEFRDVPVIGRDVGVVTLKETASSANLVHFHGHGVFDKNVDISRQSLLLSGQDVLSPAEIIEDLKLTAAPHVTLIACEMGIHDYSWGRDEPLGIPAAFILAGASSVVAPLWPIESADGRKFSEVFYHHFLYEDIFDDLGPMVNLAVSLRKAALAIRQEKKGPRHWAAFVLYGSWFCWRKPGTW